MKNKRKIVLAIPLIVGTGCNLNFGFDGTWLLSVNTNSLSKTGDCADDDDTSTTDYKDIGADIRIIQIDTVGSTAYVSLKPGNASYDYYDTGEGVYYSSDFSSILVGSVENGTLSAQYSDGSESDDNNYLFKEISTLSMTKSREGASGNFGSTIERKYEGYTDNYFTCTDGEEIPIDYVCDGYEDCYSGEDELNCGQSSVSTEVIEYECTSTLSFTGQKMDDDFLENRSYL